MEELKRLEKLIDKKKDLKKAKVLQRFFKTGKGEYGEGDIFFGITVPNQRIISKEFTNLSLNDIETLLKSKVHEKRLIALLILVEKYHRNKSDRKEIFNFYLENTNYINNWDLVDLSAEKIVGEFLKDKKRDVLYQLSKSENIWERRISILSTFYFIKNNDFEDTLRISKILLRDKHDLIQKAVGWMLREIGKRDLKVEEDFLKDNYREMPRTMLRYSIEKFDETKRKKYMNGKV